MTTEDIPFLKLDAEWMRDRYYRYLEEELCPAFIMEDEGRLLCAFGAAFLWDSVCEVWFSLIRKEKTISMIRTMRRYIDLVREKYNVRRFHATIKCNSAVSKKLVETLGFKCETPEGMKFYNPDGSDAYMYSRIIG
jgi:hypothetical protein